MSVHLYALRNRPASFATLPHGWHDPAPHPDFRHGTVIYDEPLADADVEAYELVKISTPSEIEALLRLFIEQHATGDREMLAETIDLAASDPRWFEMSVSQWLARRPVHLNHQTFASNALQALRAHLRKLAP